MSDVVNPQFWDFSQKGPPKLMHAPSVVPALWQGREYLVMTRCPLGVSHDHRKLQEYTWFLARLPNDLFNGQNDFVFKKWPDTDVYELVWPAGAEQYGPSVDRAPKPGPELAPDRAPELEIAMVRCPECEGSGDYVCEFYTDDCGMCEGEGYVTDDRL